MSPRPKDQPPLDRADFGPAMDYIRCRSVPDCRQVQELSAQIAALTYWCRYVTELVKWDEIPTNPVGGGTGGGGAPPPPPNWP